ncbi:LVIVD repeat-containing protein [Dyadobacter pollutisoli]|jgi:hypothetical protein|uniref:Uncharacterized protein n=1 Tax=Dyadobacter pollutisoli TaxID=2910158 RepID=A0A9E8SN06_9BACT|nr:hypothetical protein [Dyadobacter pollutisoli]WAC13291.1 hypothetical protein ON006_04860 [Dyadobacter pollutisoli]
MKRLAPLFFIGLAIIGLLIILTSCDGGNDSALNPQSGTGGSMARFAITGSTLYIVSKRSLEVYDISEGANPVKSVTKDMGLGIETIFPFKDNLFIGASDGMYIYDNTRPKEPVLLSKFTHIQSCDPVVVQGKYAYVTLRSGVVCRIGNTLSSLDVVDISDPVKPVLVNSQAMDSPYGLSASGNRLFVCEGDKGFRVMDISNPAVPIYKHYFHDLPSYDVISRGKHLIITGKKGLFQYQYDDTDTIELLSKIPVL